ncbi:unnamed protein product [Allacma fusca]|uniref:Uncharacterized protein n=1 Tax=Allacma fusca TaxID=39272 RepID=A0A8J2JZL9_9HEXA|nr:unnamed protein product [Allacma fusca]
MSGTSTRQVNSIFQLRWYLRHQFRNPDFHEIQVHIAISHNLHSAVQASCHPHIQVANDCRLSSVITNDGSRGN